MRNWRTLVGAALLATALSAAVAQETSTATVRVGEIDIHYRTAGTGEPLVLLHGFGHTSQVWSPFVEPLSADFTLIMPDFRGHGGSTNPSGRFTHRLAAQDLLGLMDVIGIDRFSAAGHSSGAVTLMEAALLAPGRIQAMILIGGAHRFTDETRESLAGVNAESFKAAFPSFYEEVVAWHPGGEAQFRQVMSMIPEFAADPNDVNLTSVQLSRIDTRTLIAFGDRDEINPVELALEMYRSLPNAELWVMPDTFHGAMFGWEFMPEGACGGCQAAAVAFPGIAREFLKRR